MTTFNLASDLIVRAIGARAFPAAAIEVGTPDGVLWEQAFGTFTYDPDRAATTLETLFDLASLTKVIATSTIAMRLVESGTIRLDDPVARWSNWWRGHDREDVTIADLLGHSSGLMPWADLFTEPRTRDEFERAIAASPLEYVPRSQSVYSDLDFILLGFILERAAGQTLARLFGEAIASVDVIAPRARRSGDLLFNPPAAWRARIAPTENDTGWRGRLLVGEVHDENAGALGGIAGHAGLFGTTAAVGRFARALLTVHLGGWMPGFPTPETVHRFTARTGVAGSSRALGWDTMLPTSSCGTRMSPTAFGHTGFTGTSLWLDPAARVYVVLLTNRVHPTRHNTRLLPLRPAVHDAIMGALG